MDLLKQITEALKKKGINKNIGMNTDFRSLGLDSLDLMDMVIEMEEKLNIRIPDEKLNEIKEVKDLIIIIEGLK